MDWLILCSFISVAIGSYFIGRGHGMDQMKKTILGQEQYLIELERQLWEMRTTGKITGRKSPTPYLLRWLIDIETFLAWLEEK